MAEKDDKKDEKPVPPKAAQPAKAVGPDEKDAQDTRAFENVRLQGVGSDVRPVVMIQHTPVPPAAIEDFDKTVPGGRYFVDGRWVDAHGKPIPEGKGRQDEETLKAHAEADSDLSKLK